jgi:MFS family permease
VRYTPELQTVLVRAGIFTLFATPLLALLPLLARDELGLGSAGYGMLLGAFGVGAVAGALLLPIARKRLSTDALVRGTTLLFAAAIITVAYIHRFSVACGAMIAGGVAWLMLLSIFNTAVQVAVPSWVRGRALACYLLIFFGGMAIGSTLFGIAAEWIGIPLALLLAALGLIAGVIATARSHVVVQDKMDMTPSMRWLVPMAVIEPKPDQGPVLVTLEYHIDPGRSADFNKAMREMGRIRRRDGAMSWGLWRDIADASRYVETFFIESWAEHMRQHERITNADRATEDLVRTFHVGKEPLAVFHFVSAYEKSAEA